MSAAKNTGTETVAYDSLEAALSAAQLEIPAVSKDKTAHVRSDKGNYCVAPETRVLTRDLRWVEAQKLSAGDELVAFDEMPHPDLRCRRWRAAVVEGAGIVTEPTYRIHLSDGSELVASATHRWLAINNSHAMTWIDTKDLRTPDNKRAVNSHSSRLVRAIDTWPDTRSYEMGYLAGAFDGEGSLVQTPIRRSDSERPETYQLHCTFSQRDNEMRREVDGLLAHLGFSAQVGRPGGLNEDVHPVRLAGGRAEVLRFLGQVRPLRLLAKFDPDRLGTFRCKEPVSVRALEYLGEQRLVAMKTSTGTFIADGFASHNSYRYADFYDMSAVGLPWLAKYGLGFNSKPTLNADGKFVLAYRLFHVATRQEDAGEYVLPTQGTPQSIGAAITYAKRQAFSAVTGIVADEDNDAHDGTENQTGYQRQQRTVQQRSQQAPEQRQPDQDEDTPQAARTVVKNRAKAMRRNYEDLAAEYQRRTGTALDDETRAGWIRKFIEGLDNGTVKIGEVEPAETSS